MNPAASPTTSARRDLVIVGSGMAAARLVETLRRGGDRRSIVLLGAERSLPYNRIMLSPLLAGEADWQQLITRPAEWYEQHAVELRLGAAVVAVDRAQKIVRCADGADIQYAELVFATGSRAALPPLPGIDLPGVMAFRDFDDVTALQHASALGGDAVVLGGGLLGLEAAVALAARGMHVTLVHRSPQLMNRQLDGLAANYLQRAIEKRGVVIRTGIAPAKVIGVLVDGVNGDGVNKPAAVELANGEQIPAQLVVVATGIQPVAELAQQSGLTVNHGIVVDACMRTSDDAIYAIGECNELNGETVGLVAPIWQQVEVLAANLRGEAKQFQQQPYVTMLKVSGIDVHVMGDLDNTSDTRVLTYQDRDLGIYKKLVLRNGKVAGALLFGDVADSQLFFNLIQRQSDVGANYCRLLLAGEHSTELLATA